MADFLVQRGVATIGNGATTAVITAGVGYTAPAANTKAFIQITAARAIGSEGSASTENASAIAAYVSNPANILTSITFTRSASDTTTLVIDWEIVEYTGAGGGANEFVVRLAETVTYSAASGTASGTAVTGVATDADVCLILTGQGTPGTTYGVLMSTLAWNSGTQKCDATRYPNNEATIFSYACVEFTGSNWLVQRVSHTFVAAGAQEDVTVTSVGALSRCMTFNQYRVGGDAENFSMSAQMWMSATTTASFFVNSQANIGATAPVGVMWIVSNSQTAATAMVVTRYTGTFTASGNITVTAVAATNNSSITGISQSNGQNSSSPGRDEASYRLTTTTNVAVAAAGLLDTTTYRFEVTEYPTAQASFAPTEDYSGVGLAQLPNPWDPQVTVYQ